MGWAEQEGGRAATLYVNSGAAQAPAFCLRPESPIDKINVTGYLNQLQPTARLKKSNFLEH